MLWSWNKTGVLLTALMSSSQLKFLGHMLCGSCFTIRRSVKKCKAAVLCSYSNELRPSCFHIVKSFPSFGRRFQYAIKCMQRLWHNESTSNTGWWVEWSKEIHAKSKASKFWDKIEVNWLDGIRAVKQWSAEIQVPVTPLQGEVHI